jgi:ABC-type glutathione transport system ATPase component
MTTPLLEVSELGVTYVRRQAWRRRALETQVVKDVSFSLAAGETVAVVGESGSGKTSIGRAILGLAPVSSGTIRFDGRDITFANTAERRRLASDMQVIFQNPYGSLNPSLSIGDILTEPLRVREKLSQAESLRIVRHLLERVGMPADAAERYPGNFSGGQRQRIAIARALSVRPRLVICDEPTSALDVSTQATVLDLLAELQRDTGMSYLFISHDLAVVRRFADRVAVLNKGTIVEIGDVESVCDRPRHAYTQALIAAAPVPDPVLQRARRQARLEAIQLAAGPRHAGPKQPVEAQEVQEAKAGTSTKTSARTSE